MSFVVIILAVLFIGLGLWGLMTPARLLASLSRWQTRRGLWAGAGLRLLFGIALWYTAPSSRFPITLQVLAVISVVAGVALPFIGLARFKSLFVWWSRKSPSFMRVWAVVTMALGVFIIWAVAG